mgnify:CR=1 FL=1
MITIAICAKCGKRKELCDSIRRNGIKQPRICKDCLINSMETGDESIDKLLWILQMIELKDDKSLELLKIDRTK